MNYDFSFSKKTIIFALAGFVFVGGMLFIAGLLIGTTWKAEPNVAANVAAQQAAAPAPPPPPATQPEPLMTMDLSKPEVAPLNLSAATGAPAPVKQAHANIAGVYSRREPIYNTPVSPDDGGELEIISEADSSANESAETNAFSVQVGVFASENDAHLLVRQLQKKGYTPIVLAASDDRSRLFYAVRLGTYRSPAEAAKAASNISEQEKIEAIVRPLGSL